MDMEKIPYIAFEAEQVRHERLVRRLIAALVVVVALLFVSNMIWLYEWTQYDYVTEENVTIDGKQGNANYVGRNGNILNGKDYGTQDKAQD